jgi:N-acetyl sugar amidotransferase
MICKKCLMPDTRPRVVFTDGVCNACLHTEERAAVDWGERRKEFELLLNHHVGRDPSAPYDCIVPFSGGKDSATIAWKLKHEFGLRPLLVCYGQMLWTDVGRHNLDSVCNDGFDIHYHRVDQRVSRTLARRFTIERGHPKQHYDAGVNSVPLQVAVQMNIPLVFYAEHGESFYGGLVLDEESRRTRNLTEVLEHQVGDHPSNWVDDDISERDLYPYIYPDLADVERVGVKAFYWSYFFPWDIYENARLARTGMRFKQARNSGSDITPNAVLLAEWKQRADLPDWWGKSDGSFEGFDSIDDMIDDLDFYLMWVKFGFGRSTRMASRLIQMGHMTREQGEQLVQRYDGEFPDTYLPQVLDYLRMTRDELDDVIRRHWNPNAHGGELCPIKS